VLLTTDQLNKRGFTPPLSKLTTTENYQHQLRCINKLFKSAQKKDSKLLERNYQLESAAMYCCRKDNMAALSQGLGKTLIAALVAANLYSQTDRPGTIHICIPNITMLGRWLTDLQLLFLPEEIVVLSNKDLGRASLPRKHNLIREAKILIYTHDFPRYCDKKNCATNAKYLIQSAAPSLLIIDEIHHFKDNNSLKYQALEVVARKSKRVLGLSGTLTEGNLESLSNILQLVYQKDWVYFRQPNKLQSLFGKSLELGLNYCTGEKVRQKGTKQLQSINQDRLSDYYNTVRKYVHRLSIDQVRLQIKLPEVEFKAYGVQFTQNQKEAYDRELSKSSKLLMGLQETDLSLGSATYAQSLLQSAIEICNQGVDGCATNKSQLTVSLTESAQKTVVFCQHIKSAGFIYKQLVERWGADKVIRVYSKDISHTPPSQNPQERWKQIDKFENDPNVKVGVFSLNLAAEALDLVAADRVIVYCAPWSGAKFDQCLRRTLRPGNRHPKIEIITIYHEKAIDRYQLQLLEAKQKIGRLLLDYTEVTAADSDKELVRSALKSFEAT
jgi:superfamily II DNA or RNA helicase